MNQFIKHSLFILALDILVVLLILYGLEHPIVQLSPFGVLSIIIWVLVLDGAIINIYQKQLHIALARLWLFLLFIFNSLLMIVSILVAIFFDFRFNF